VLNKIYKRPESSTLWEWLAQSVTLLFCAHVLWRTNCYLQHQTKWRKGSLGCEFRPEFASQSDPYYSCGRKSR